MIHPSIIHIKPNNSKVHLEKPNNSSKAHKDQQLNNKIIHDRDEDPDTFKIPHEKEKVSYTIQNKERINYATQK